MKKSFSFLAMAISLLALTQCDDGIPETKFQMSVLLDKPWVTLPVGKPDTVEYFVSNADGPVSVSVTGLPDSINYANTLTDSHGFLTFFSTINADISYSIKIIFTDNSTTVEKEFYAATVRDRLPHEMPGYESPFTLDVGEPGLVYPVYFTCKSVWQDTVPYTEEEQLQRALADGWTPGCGIERYEYEKTIYTGLVYDVESYPMDTTVIPFTIGPDSIPVDSISIETSAEIKAWMELAPDKKSGVIYVHANPDFGEKHMTDCPEPGVSPDPVPYIRPYFDELWRPGGLFDRTAKVTLNVSNNNGERKSLSFEIEKAYLYLQNYLLCWEDDCKFKTNLNVDISVFIDENLDCEIEKNTTETLIDECNNEKRMTHAVTSGVIHIKKTTENWWYYGEIIFTEPKGKMNKTVTIHH